MAKKILILAANPKNRSRLRLDQEVREIDNGLQRAQRRDEFILKPVLAVRYSDFRRAMLDFKPNIVHFCGHGSGEGIAFEDENGLARFMSAEALSGFFELFADTVECVVLNACYSELQAEAIAKHIPYVIGMSQEIEDAAAIEFSVTFYDALGAGRSIEFAYELACSTVRASGLSRNLTPILHKPPRRPSEQVTGTSIHAPQKGERKFVFHPSWLIVILVYVGFALWTSAYVFKLGDGLFMNPSSLLSDPDTGPPLFSLKFLKTLGTLFYIGYATVIFIITFKLSKHYLGKSFLLLREYIKRYTSKYHFDKYNRRYKR